MAVRDILQIGNPRLKAKSRAIKKFNSLRLKQVVKDLVETMHQNDLVGLAAPPKKMHLTTDSVENALVYLRLSLASVCEMRIKKKSA